MKNAALAILVFTAALPATRGANNDPFGLQAIIEKSDREIERQKKAQQEEWKKRDAITEDRIKGPEVEISLPPAEHDGERWTARLKVKRTTASVVFFPVPVDSSDDSWVRKMQSVDVDRTAQGELEATLSILQKGVRWAKIAEEKKPLEFSKPLGKVGHNEWTFRWDPVIGARFGHYESLEPWQAETALELLARLPEADNALAEKKKALAEQDALFR